MAPVPKDAAAVILLRPKTDPTNPEVFWVQRSEKMAFLGGFHAFPGGQLDALDAAAPIINCPDPERAALISCAAREVFEELGVLLARGSESLTKGQRTSLFDDLTSGRMNWPNLLRHYELELDAEDFTFVGRWLTPPFSPRRFNTWFFLVKAPVKQEPAVTTDGELAQGEWISAREAYARWQRCEILAVPPILHALKTIGSGLTTDLVERFLSAPHAHAEPVRRIEFKPNFICFPLRTPTKPPATHTNCYLIYTSQELLVIDPGSPYEEEQLALLDCVKDLLTEGRSVQSIVLTHLHPDHISGVNALLAHLNTDVTVAAHRLTAQGIAGEVQVDKLIENGEVISLQGEPQIKLEALHTPGHARGHLCFYEATAGVLLTGDNILGLSSVLIDPPEGNMQDYLDSLQRMRKLPNLTVLLPGHGPAMANPYTMIDQYIAHRLEREQQILDALRQGATTPGDIVKLAYTDVSPKALPMAERSVLAHLEKLEADGVVVKSEQGIFQTI